MSEDILNKRNIAALHEAFKSLQAVVAQQGVEIRQLQSNNSQLTTQVQQMQQQVHVLRATSVGRGPTG